MASYVSFNSSELLEQLMTILAEGEARAIAIAFPIPRDAPVTNYGCTFRIGFVRIKIVRINQVYLL